MFSKLSLCLVSISSPAKILSNCCSLMTVYVPVAEFWNQFHSCVPRITNVKISAVLPSSNLIDLPHYIPHDSQHHMRSLMNCCMLPYRLDYILFLTPSFPLPLACNVLYSVPFQCLFDSRSAFLLARNWLNEFVFRLDGFIEDLCIFKYNF